jgi:hypothetical protein
MIQKDAVLQEWEQCTSGVHAVCLLSPSLFASSGRDSKIRIFSFDAPSPRAVMIGHKSWVVHLRSRGAHSPPLSLQQTKKKEKLTPCKGTSL